MAKTTDVSLTTKNAMEDELLREDIRRLTAAESVLPGGHADVRSFLGYGREELDGVIELEPDTHPRAPKTDTATCFVRRHGVTELAAVRMDDPDIIGAAMTVKRRPRPKKTARSKGPTVFRRRKGETVLIPLA